MMTRPRPHQPDHLTFSGVVADSATCYRRRQVFAATKGAQMLRGLATVSFWAADLAAAKEWYAELLGIDPYFERAELDGRIVAPGDPRYDQARPGYIEFRLGDYQHELGLIDSRYAPHGSATGPAGAVVYWHIDDVPATLDRLLSLGAKQYEAPRDFGGGFIGASVVD